MRSRATSGNADETASTWSARPSINTSVLNPWNEKGHGPWTRSHHGELPGREREGHQRRRRWRGSLVSLDRENARARQRSLLSRLTGRMGPQHSRASALIGRGLLTLEEPRADKVDYRNSDDLSVVAWWEGQVSERYNAAMDPIGGGKRD